MKQLNRAELYEKLEEIRKSEIERFRQDGLVFNDQLERIATDTVFRFSKTKEKIENMSLLVKDKQSNSWEQLTIDITVDDEGNEVANVNAVAYDDVDKEFSDDVKFVLINGSRHCLFDDARKFWLYLFHRSNIAIRGFENISEKRAALIEELQKRLTIFLAVVSDEILDSYGSDAIPDFTTFINSELQEG